MSTNNNSTLGTSIWTKAIPNQSPALVIVCTVFIIITTAFFATRFTYRWQTKQRGWDDLMAALAYLTLLTMTALGYATASYGFGKHREDIKETFPTAMFYFYLYQILYKLIGGFTKLNFCFLYLRIFSFKGFQKVVIANAVIIALGSMAFALVTIFQCLPIERNWDKRVDGYCINNMAFWYSHAAFNTLMDIVVYILPIPLIRTLHMKSRTKTGLIAIFALGAFTIAASIVRMLMLRDSANSTSDPTWGSMHALIWTEIEANTSVICCCLPALRTLFVQGWRRITGTSGGETMTPQNSSNDKIKATAQQPRLPSKFFGNRTQIRYSPPGSSHNLNLDKESVTKPTRAWLGAFSQPFNHHKRGASNVSERELAQAEEGGISNVAPKLDLGQIYKRTDVEVQSNRQSRFEGRGSGDGKGEGEEEGEEISLMDILNERRG